MEPFAVAGAPPLSGGVVAPLGWRPSPNSRRPWQAAAPSSGDAPARPCDATRGLAVAETTPSCGLAAMHCGASAIPSVLQLSSAHVSVGAGAVLAYASIVRLQRSGGRRRTRQFGTSPRRESPRRFGLRRLRGERAISSWMAAASDDVVGSTGSDAAGGSPGGNEASSSDVERDVEGAAAEAPEDSDPDDGEEAAHVRLARESLMRQFQNDAAVAAGRALAREEHDLWASMDEDGSATGSRGLPVVGSVVLARPSAYAAAFEKMDIRPDSDPESLIDCPIELPAAAVRTGLAPTLPTKPRRERARLPVVLITRRSSQGTEGLLLGAWSGKLLGDCGFNVFMTRPLYVGGPHERNLPLLMLNSYPQLGGSMRLTPDGLALGDDFAAAADWVEGENAGGSPLRFKFFFGRVRWSPAEEEELLPSSGVWFPPARCSRELLLREPDSAFEEPLWAQIAERAGGEIAAAAREHGLLAPEDDKVGP